MKRLILAFGLLAAEHADAQRLAVDVGMFDLSGRSFLWNLSLEGSGRVFPAILVGAFSSHDRPTTFGSFGAGVRTDTAGFVVGALMSGACLDRTTPQLGTAFEFRSAVWTEWNWGGAFLRLGLSHLSNGRRVFRFRGPNRGETFIVTGVGWALP